MFDAKRLLIDAVCVAVLAGFMTWGAEAIANVPLTLPATIAGAAADCEKPAVPPKETTVAGGLPGLNLADCGDKEGKTPAAGAQAPAEAKTPEKGAPPQ
jgi:hypothetical protein